jgi:hypothetical protein
MKTYLRRNGLTFSFLALFLAALVGQALSGNAEYNAMQATQGGSSISLWRYLTTSDFAVDVAENWQSEYLQFFLYVIATVWLVQHGSTESKEIGKEGRGTDEEQKLGAFIDADSPKWAKAGGWRTAVFSKSLGLVMGTIFLLSWLAQSIAGRAAFNGQALGQLQDPVTWLGYLGEADFWSRTFQNWQSEFLAVASMAALSIYLRQRGSPESKPVGAAHGSTAENG